MTRSAWTVSLCALLVSANVALATPTAETSSLNNCQNAVKVATAQFVSKKVAAIGACLQAVSTQIVKNNAPDASAAATSCVTQFRKLDDSRGLGKALGDKLAAAITKKCDPTQPGVTHTLADIIGTGAGVAQPLDAQDLNAWCSHFGGDGSIDTLQEWTACLTTAAECDVDSAIAAQYPRALDWLVVVKPSMQALIPPATDPNKITDAVAGLDAIKAEIDGPNNDNVVSLQCGDNGVCDANLSSCNSSLGTCNGNLSTCNANYSSCSGSLATCNAGTATAADVLSGKTFSSGAGLGVVGSVPAGANVNGTNGLKIFAIPDGLYAGSKTATANDSNLAASNIANGVSIFGVTGTALPAQQLKTGQTSAYGTSSDGDLQKGVARSYTDNGDGTITDNKTGLMWEKKDQSGGIHDWTNIYTWGLTSSPYTMNGTMVTTFLATLNAGGGFAGHTDWRIPNVNELQSIANYQNFSPAVDAVFNISCAASCTVTTCSCTSSNFYWSSTTYQNSPDNAWGVSCSSGMVTDNLKSPNSHVRAVRGGS